MGLKKWIAKLLNIEPEVRVATSIDNELATRDSEIKALLTDNLSKSGIISRLEAEKRKVKDREEEINKEAEKSQELSEQQLQIMREKFKDSISLRKLFDYMNKHPKFKIDMMDRDMSKKFCRFDDIVIFSDGEMATLDPHKNIMSKGKKINEVFFKPGSLGGQIDKGLIRLPCDTEFRGIPDIEEIEIPECTYDPIKGKIKWAKFSYKELGKLIKDREEKINNLSIYNQELEESKASLFKSNIEYKRKNNILVSKIKNYEVENSRMTNLYKSMDKKFRNVTSKLAHSQSMKSLAENLKDKYKESIDELSQFVADKLSKTEYDTFLDRVKDMNDWINEKTTIVPVQQVQPTKPTPQPQT